MSEAEKLLRRQRLRIEGVLVELAHIGIVGRVVRQLGADREAGDDEAAGNAIGLGHCKLTDIVARGGHDTGFLVGLDVAVCATSFCRCTVVAGSSHRRAFVIRSTQKKPRLSPGQGVSCTFRIRVSPAGAVPWGTSTGDRSGPSSRSPEQPGARMAPPA